MKLIFQILFLFQAQIIFAQSVKITAFHAKDVLTDSMYVLDNQQIMLDFKKNHVAIFYHDSTDSAFEIRLIGFENKWQNVGKQDYANYINLLGGAYEFQVKNLRFPAKIASVKFKIADAFWQRSWFIPAIVGYILLVAGIVFYLFQSYRFRQQMSFQQVRNNIAADLHDDIGSTLSTINLITEIAKTKEKTSEILPLLDKISEDSKEMIQTMRGMVWTINPSNDNAHDFFEKVRSFVQEMIAAKNIKLIFDLQIPDSQILSVEVQRNIFLIFKEAINNINKYSEASEVKIIVRKQDNWLMLQISDNGLGFEMDEENEGNGLKNMQNRAEQLGGTFELKSDNGTRIRIALPLSTPPPLKGS